MSNAQKFPYFPISLLLLIFYTFSFLIKTDFSFDQDLGRHLKLGELIIQSNQVPTVNLFSYTYPQFPFINHHYLFEVIIFWGKQLVGLTGLLTAKILLILISVWLILMVTKRSSIFFLLPLGFIFLHPLRERTDLRPEILSFLFTALTYFILDQFEHQKTKLIFFLPLISLIWISSHIYFPLEFILQGVFLLHFYLKKDFSKAKTLFFITILSILISIFNPNGVSALFYPLKIFDNYGYTVVENQNLFLLENLNFYYPSFLFVKLATLLIIISIIVGLIRQQITIKNFLLSILGLGLSLWHIRSFPYLFFISLPSTMENFGLVQQPRLNLFLFSVSGLLLLLESFFYLNQSYYQQTDQDVKTELSIKAHGEKALDFVLEKDLPRPVFNNFDIGSYILYRGYPTYQVFVDGRPEAYPKEFFQEIYLPAQESPQTFDQLDQKFNFQTIIFSHTDQTPWGQTFLKFIIHHPGWRVVFIDDFMIVLVKKDEALKKGLEEISLDHLSPAQYQFTSHVSYLRLGIFLINNDHPKSGQQFIQKALMIGYQKSKRYIWW